MRRTGLEHQFVKSFPRPMVEGVLYVSMEYASAAHKCCCGCGNDVITRLAPRDWRLTFDGRSVSLFPSIGNWNFPCQSHYWIKKNRVDWDLKWSKAEIDALRRDEASEDDRETQPTRQKPAGFWEKARRWLD